ncbi:MAG: ion channel [Myxococcota bacterium]
MAPPARLPSDPQNAIRIGLRLSLWTDLYYHLMRGSWWLLIGLFGGCYLLANLGFACLYMMQFRGISDAEAGSFGDAFAFSVQTISTIGYGTLAPTSGAVHTLVTFEAMLGLLGTALATGLVFAKFSRPRAKVLFTDNMLISPRNGKPALVFRVGNARGNELIEASLRVATLVPEVTAEGETMRRLVDLPLLRSTTPMFAMTWTVIHEIDEDSPLYGRSPPSLTEDHVRFIVSMTGIDGTFSQTVHARHIYEAKDIKWGHRFVDIVDYTEDGRLRINYVRFHDTRPIEESTPEPLEPIRESIQ